MRAGNICILGFDTSGPYCAVAVLCDDEVLAHRHEEMTKGQAENLMGLIAETLRQADVDYDDLSAIGVGIGPGNFTGIRIAVSAARGLALGLKIPAVGISAFDALHFGASGHCTCLVDARRGQFYAQSYDEAGPVSEPILLDGDELADQPQPLIGAGGQQAAHDPAQAIARLAKERFRTTVARPAPLYLRPADAAPAKDAGPVILP